MCTRTCTRDARGSTYTAASGRSQAASYHMLENKMLLTHIHVYRYRTRTRTRNVPHGGHFTFSGEHFRCDAMAMVLKTCRCFISGVCVSPFVRELIREQFRTCFSRIYTCMRLFSLFVSSPPWLKLPTRLHMYHQRNSSRRSRRIRPNRKATRS